MAQKPSIPKGTRDFGPVEMAKRNYIFNTIKEVYALYGFQQIETPNGSSYKKGGSQFHFILGQEF